MRSLALTVALGLALVAGLVAQQVASPVSGKWDVNVTGQAKRSVDLTVEGTAVRGSLASGAETAEVTGEFRDGSLSFWTTRREEYFTVGLRDGVWQGTYVDSRTQRAYKTGVTLSRPPTK